MGKGHAADSMTPDVDTTYVSLFVLKHVCSQCMGTMAPLPPGGDGSLPSSVCSCNRCGATRTEAEFLERVQEHFADDDDDDE